MRKIALLLALIIVISMPISAQAATPRARIISPAISYSGNTATCTARIIWTSTSNYLEATIKLWNGNSCIKTWDATGYGYILFSETATVVTGNTYTLTVDLSVDGVAQTTSSISKKCE